MFIAHASWDAELALTLAEVSVQNLTFLAGF